MTFSNFKRLYFIGFSIIAIMVMGCQEQPKEKDLNALAGYWEIEQVVFPSGNSKTYPASMDVDYLFLDGLKGYRKKVKPAFDGSFETSDVAQSFTLEKTENHWKFMYANALTQWEERLLSLSKNNFSVENSDGLQYHYKRYEPINLD